MMLSILHALGTFATDLFKSRCQLESENLFLCHQLNVALRFAPPRFRLCRSDRAPLVWMIRLWPSLLGVAQVVQPETILRWHCMGFKAFWRWKSRKRVGWPKIDRGLRDLIRRMNRENPMWRDHAQAIAAIDPCVVPTLTFDRLFAFLILGHGRRQLLRIEVTRHPTAEWLARQITETFPWTSAPAYLVRDNDGAYGHVFTSRLRVMGIRDRPISPASPWQNRYAERLIGTVRRECLDRMVIFGESDLRRVLASYWAYYNQARTYLALQKDAPLHRAV
jgi:Integrase core domain